MSIELRLSNLEIKLDYCILDLERFQFDNALVIKCHVKFDDGKELIFGKQFKDITELETAIRCLSDVLESSVKGTETCILNDVIINGNYVDMTSSLVVKDKLVMLTIYENIKVSLTKSVIDTNLLLTKLHDYLTILIGEI